MKKRAKVLVPAWVCLATLSTLPQLAAAEGITLQQAVQQAVSKNPDVLTRWHAFRAATEEIGVVSGAYRPKLDLTADLARERQKSPLTGDVTENYTRNDASLVFDQILYDGGYTRNQVKKFNSAQRVRYNELLDASEASALDAMKAYIDVQRYRKLHDLAIENYTHHRAVFEQIEQRVKSGVGRRVDLEQASGRLALAESNLLTEASNLHDVSARYQRIIGSLPPEVMADVPALSEGIPDNADQALREAYAGNPALAAAQENIVASQYDAKLRDSRFLPRFDLVAQHEVGKNLSGQLGRTNLSNVGVQLSYNLYNGGADNAAKRQYGEQLNVAKDMRDKECRDLRQTLFIAYNDVKRLTEQLGYLEQHMLSQQKALTAYYSQFDIGQRTLLDLLDSENEVFQAKRAYQNAYFDRLLAMGRTHAAMGDLVKSLDAEHLDTEDLAKSQGTAEFDPDTACPVDNPAQVKDDKDALYAGMSNWRGAPRVVDSDGDGVPDGKDACANTAPGTRVDAKGCPLPAVIELKGVTFEYASDKLRPEASVYAVLDEAVDTLKQNPDLKVEIAGHTDNNNHSSDPDLNKKLSLNRAKAVMEYLIAHGVAADRLTAQGYADTQPIADNATKEGQARNRRVEMRIQK